MTNIENEFSSFIASQITKPLIKGIQKSVQEINGGAVVPSIVGGGVVFPGLNGNVQRRQLNPKIDEILEKIREDHRQKGIQLTRKTFNPLKKMIRKRIWDEEPLPILFDAGEIHSLGQKKSGN